jgi:predicted nucleotidyltransferase
VYKEVARLVEGGYIGEIQRGNTRLLRAVEDSALTPTLTDLFALTYGPLPVLTDLLTGIDGIREAYIYGSWAARYLGEPGRIPNDVDVLVVGDVDRDRLYGIGLEAQDTLRREVNIRRVFPETWAAAADSFLKHVKERPLVKLEVNQ